MFLANNDLLFSEQSFLNEYCIDFNGSNTNVNTPIDVLDITGAMSIIARVKVDNTGSLQMVVCKDATGGTKRSWLLYYRGTAAGVRAMRFSWWTTSGTVNTLTSSTVGYFEDGLWHTVIITITGTTETDGVKMYIDDALDVEMTASGVGIRSYSGTNSGIAIGSASNRAGWFYGGVGTTPIDEIAVWDGVILTPTEASDIDNGGIPKDISSYNPELWCRLGENAVWDGTNWIFTNQGTLSLDWDSKNVLEADRIDPSY